MNRAKPLSTLSAAMLAFAVIAPSAYADSQPVKVTNSTANPVPVNGNVVVSGTANVNVTNPVTIANPVSAVTVSGTPSVNVANVATVRLDASTLFNVPFTTNAVLSALIINLPRPAILESFSIEDCSPGTNAIYLTMENPTPNGVTFDPPMAPVTFPLMNPTTIALPLSGAYNGLPPTYVGAVVEASLRLNIYAAAGAVCRGNAVFRTIN
jgi:hypothetical protein